MASRVFQSELAKIGCRSPCTQSLLMTKLQRIQPVLSGRDGSLCFLDDLQASEKVQNKNETMHSIPSERNVRSNRPCNIWGIDFSRNSEPKPRRAGSCAIVIPHSRQRSRSSFSLPRS